MDSVTRVKRGLDVVAVLLDIGPLLENTAILQSQVGEKLIALAGLGYRVGTIAIVNDVVAFDRVIGQRLRDAGVRIELVRDRGFFRNLLAIASRVRAVRSSTPIRVAYVRGIWSPLALLLANPLDPLRHVYDVRGALSDETRAAGRSYLKARIYARLEARGIRTARHVIAVTNALAEAVSARNRGVDVTVVPCCVSIELVSATVEVAANKRAEAEYSPSDIVVVYSGGLSHYQQVPAMLALWRRLMDDASLHFLLLTNDSPQSVPAVVGDLSDFGGRLRHMTLTRLDVPAMLAAADIGFMLRDTRELNRVASPVKFPEYLAAGLAVVASPGTGDISGLVEKYRLGALVDPAHLDAGEATVRELIAVVKRDRASVKERARALAASHFDWRGHAPTFRHIYGVPSLDAQQPCYEL